MKVHKIEALNAEMNSTYTYDTLGESPGGIMPLLRLWIVCSLALAPAAVAARSSLDQTVTIDLQNAEIAQVIRLVAEASGKNVVIADDVKGKVTMRLRSVSWRTALDVLLKTGGYGVQETDGVLWVTTQARLDAEELRELTLEEQRAQKGPLSVRVVPVNHGDAKAMAELVKPLLSPRGSVSVDARTNTLIIRDVDGSSALR
jgi:type IV pilus assembly protein PilQ